MFPHIFLDAEDEVTELLLAALMWVASEGWTTLAELVDHLMKAFFLSSGCSKIGFIRLGEPAWEEALATANSISNT